MRLRFLDLDHEYSFSPPMIPCLHLASHSRVDDLRKWAKDREEQIGAHLNDMKRSVDAQNARIALYCHRINLLSEEVKQFTSKLLQPEEDDVMEEPGEPLEESTKLVREEPEEDTTASEEPEEHSKRPKRNQWNPTESVRGKNISSRRKKGPLE